MCYHISHAVYPRLQTFRSEWRAATPLAGLPLLDLAPGGGCLAADVTARAGGLLHHLFTLAPTRKGDAVCFCGPIRQVAPSRVLPGTLPCGVRTFLDGC